MCNASDAVSRPPDFHARVDLMKVVLDLCAVLNESFSTIIGQGLALNEIFVPSPE